MHLFSACLNACIILVNQAGINQKQTGFAALTVFMGVLEGSQGEYVVSADLRYANSENAKISFGVIIDLVCDKDLNMLHLETQSTFGDDIFDVVDALAHPQVQEQLKHMVGYQIKINQCQSPN